MKQYGRSSASMRRQPAKEPCGSYGHLYRKTARWAEFKPHTQCDYEQYSLKRLEVMGNVPAQMIRPADIARYVRVEHADAPVRGNREVALPSNLMNVAIERGDIDVNPCKQVKKNSEKARTEAPEPEELRRFLEWLACGGAARRTLALLMGTKQHGGSKKTESIQMGSGMEQLAKRLLALPRPKTSLHMFINQKGNPLTEAGFTTGWQRAMVGASFNP